MTTAYNLAPKLKIQRPPAQFSCFRKNANNNYKPRQPQKPRTFEQQKHEIAIQQAGEDEPDLQQRRN